MLVTSYGYSTMTSFRMSPSCTIFCFPNVRPRTGTTHSILNDAVYAHMCEVQEAHHPDFMRAFFRLRAGDIGLIIQKLPDVAANSAKETGRSIAHLLPETNRTVLVCASLHYYFRCAYCRLDSAKSSF